MRTAIVVTTLARRRVTSPGSFASSRPSTRSLVVAALLGLATVPASAADLVVDAGGGSSYTTIDAAMAKARPGDRILVLPGSYPAFQFSKGVHVHGMGATPGDVVVARVDYHPSEPTVGYDSSLTNLSVSSTTATPGYLAVTGNELPPGVFVMDGIFIEGGVFLAGGADDGFSLLVTNSRVSPSAGQGFGGASVHVGGPNSSVEIVDSTIDGADADPDVGLPAFAALRLVGGTRARLSNVRIHGGDGALGGDSTFESGADGVVDGFWPAPVSLRVDGSSSIRGGFPIGFGLPGDSVDVSGSIELGDAQVSGGPAGLPGAAWADAQPVALPFDLHLVVEPVLQDASSKAFVHTGETLVYSMDTPAGTSAIVFSFALDQPPASKFFTLSSLPVLLVAYGNVAAFSVPTSPFAWDVPAVMLHAQGLARDATGLLHLTQTATVRADLLVNEP